MGMLVKSLKHSKWYASKILQGTRYAEQNKEVRGTPWGEGGIASDEKTTLKILTRIGHIISAEDLNISEMRPSSPGLFWVFRDFITFNISFGVISRSRSLHTHNYYQARRNFLRWSTCTFPKNDQKSFLRLNFLK